MHFIGMEGIGGVEAIGMVSLYSFMGGYEGGNGYENYIELRFIPLRFGVILMV